MVLNIGPQHPATHGTLRLVVRLDGERVVAADPIIGYMHRGYEKLTEFRTYPQITTLINRIDWLSSFANEVPFISRGRKAHGHRSAAACASTSARSSPSCRASRRSCLFLGEMGLQVGAITPAFYGFRDREYVLNLIEAVTGGRFHPNFNRIGGIKDDLPWGLIADCKTAMNKVLASCDEFEDLVVGNPIFEQRTRSIGIIPRRARRGVRRVGFEPPRVRRRLGPAARRPAVPRLQRARLEGVDAPRRRLVRALLGAAAGNARVGAHGAADARPDAGRPDHGEGAAHHQGARGRGLGQHREPARRDGLLRRSRRARPARSA